MEDVRQLTAELMRGAYDLHIHTLPSVFKRKMDGMEIVREADRAGMAGVMLKSHYEPTALRAELINKYSGCRTKAYGGLALNWPVGGLNVYAVDEALKAGAKIIWMPTRDAANSLVFGAMEGDFFRRPGITLTCENGRLKDEVYEIMDTVRANDGWLATGHISPKESVLLCKEGRARKVNMILTHPEFPRTTMPKETQKELADLGVLVEKNWFNVAQKAVSIYQMAENIRYVGAERCYIATDRGQYGMPSPTEEFRRFIGALLEQGMSEEELSFLARKNPERIIG